jgi:putative transposase
MKIEFNNLYTHFVFITLGRQFMIPEKSRIRIEKYITGIVSKNASKLYAIYANPEHVHLLKYYQEKVK